MDQLPGLQSTTKFNKVLNRYLQINNLQSLNKLFFFELGFTSFKVEQSLQDMELQEKEEQKDYSKQEISLERIYG